MYSASFDIYLFTKLQRKNRTSYYNNNYSMTFYFCFEVYVTLIVSYNMNMSTGGLSYYKLVKDLVENISKQLVIDFFILLIIFLLGMLTLTCMTLEPSFVFLPLILN